MNEIRVNNNKLPIRDYNGQRVVTFKDIDTVHERKDGTAKRNFYTNRERFIEGVDFFKVKYSEVCTNFVHTPNGYNPNADLTLMTESGYLMLLKSFTDDLAWQVQRELVNNYFRVKAPESEQLTLETLEEEGYRYLTKTYNGVPVITLADFEHFTGFSHKGLGYHVKKQCKLGEDYFHIRGAELFRFKNENPEATKLYNNILLLKASAVRRLLQYLGLSAEIPIITENKPVIAVKKEDKPAVKPTSSNVDEFIIALGVLGVVRDNLKRAENTEAEEAVNTAIKFTSWELSKRAIR